MGSLLIYDNNSGQIIAFVKKAITEVLDAFGWDTEDMGTAAATRAIGPPCILWCIPGFLNIQWSHAFKLLKP